MAIRPAHMFREAGAALAVLALYVLVLLAPLHQAAGLQRDLSQVGYESQWSWSVCSSLGEDSDTDTSLAIKCPLANAGKFELAAFPAPAPSLPTPRIIGELVYPQAASQPFASSGGRPGAPRGPPAAA